MARKKPPASAPLERPGASLAQDVAAAMTKGRAVRIREARARVPTPTYEQIAVEVGCCVRTVYNVVHELTHAPDPAPAATTAPADG